MLKVMVVDDEEQIRQGIVKILTRYQGELEIAGQHANGLEALLQISSMEPGDLDLILTDIEMPMMNGLDFIAQAKSKLPDLCVIMLSGYNDFEYARRAMRAGATDYLLKPMDKVEVFRLLAQCEEKKHAALQHNQTKEAALPASAPATEKTIVERIRKLLGKEYSRDIDLKYISGEIGLSSSYISKVFSRETGETITDCLNGIRIAKAKQFLRDHPNLKVYEIAHSVGYGDKIYFQKLFKRMVGVTPLEYRGGALDG
ncbi:response regulator transcription factor [Paenibacillus radicis (ex Gao et al. 2016)]|uniref:DNA-binding response regulator n=1 Tax=Paenibacillus radicis (ex Gao et al. 2016) TaxID=1737354 RepID=A0A917HHG3_9BACL|nr:response regulator [Paenibacillus radicis (ex Gao et al. 2016)]GGG78752.1 DNA-binding response regulator [Paenibacillus radicis (ex Gao et al. 2016)]